MKPKGLLLALFILYWIAVYGIALFSGKFRNDFRQTSLSHFVPYGYSMFTPMTKTTFDVSYQFYKDGNLAEIVSLRNYLDAEFNKGLFHNKASTVKSRVYLEQIYKLDLAFQKEQYAGINNPENQDFEKTVANDESLKSIAQNIINFSKIYKEENPSLEADSVGVSVYRKPMILPFNPGYKGDYTYILGDMVFYKSSYIFPNSTDRL